MRSIEDPKVVLVTGAARGLGWGIARAFGLAGAQVVVTDIEPDELKRCATDLESDNSTYQTFLSDVADLSACQTLIQEVVNSWDRLDVIVHNAIYMPLITFDATTPDEWRRQLDVGLGGMFNLTYSAWDQIKQQGGGHIIGIGSGSSYRGFKEEIAYCTIKHGVDGFVKSLSLEARDYNIAINTIGPGAPIKPTRMTWQELDNVDPDVASNWADPLWLGRAWVWLANQPPSRFNGFRFDAAQIVRTLDSEGEEFEFAAEKVTLLPDDFRAREIWYKNYPD